MQPPKSRPSFVVLVVIGDLPLQEIVNKSLVTEAKTHNESRGGPEGLAGVQRKSEECLSVTHADTECCYWVEYITNDRVT